MNSSANNAYLYAAYIVVWLVHGSYVWSLYARSRRIRRETRELKRS